MQPNLQTIIVKGLLHDETFCRKALPHIKPEYFEGEHRVVYDLILKFISKYNKLPNSAVLDIEFRASNHNVGADTINVAKLISDVDTPEIVEYDWLVDSTEKWCKDRAVYIAIMESIQIIDGKAEGKAEGMIPDILSKALAVTFDTNVGHDYLEDAEKRYDYYHRVEDKIAFDIDMLNKITNGGVSRKTLNIILAGTAVGKSLAMCHLAAAAMAQGRSVLYITMEMAEEKIAERNDANLFDINIDQITNLSKEMFNHKIKGIAAKTHGKLIIKEYPTGAAHAGHFRALLMELKLKKNFVPDIIFIDYLNICASSRIKGGAEGGTYSLIKSIAEELRGLAVEFNVPIWSATQVTRSGYASSDVEITDTSESFGLPATADLMIALMSTEQLEKMGQIMIKQLKNRYNDVGKYKRFTVGVDRAKMRLYDIADPMANIANESSSQSNVVQTPFSAGKPERKQFTGFKT
jgi:replicative DNA helicase